jgi:hypothetical protein
VGPTAPGLGGIARLKADIANLRKALEQRLGLGLKPGGCGRSGHTLTGMKWDALTAIGTLALAVMTLAAVVVAIVITSQDRRRADERSRRERLWSDAEMVADLEQLLIELDPVRRGMNAAPLPAEHEGWALRFQRVGLAEARLHMVAIGHESGEVRSLAREMPRVLYRAAMSAREHVYATLGEGHDLAASLDEAQTRHRKALDALGQLEATITSAGTAKPRRRRR